VNSLRINVRASALTLPLYMQDQFELYEAEFGGQVTEKDFKLATKKINNALLDHWPCLNCRFFAYGNGPSPDCHRMQRGDLTRVLSHLSGPMAGCCLCTLGGSMYYVASMWDEARDSAAAEIKRLNRKPAFADRNVTWDLRVSW
jgi:hypothetical protein